MTQHTENNACLVQSPVIKQKRADRKQINIEEIVESLKIVGDDIGQIGKLTSKEKILVSEFLASLLKRMQPCTSSIAVSLSAIPIRIGEVTEAYLESTGHLALTFKDGRLELKDLSEPENRDLLMAIVGDILPKLQNLTGKKAKKVIQEQPKLQTPPETPVNPIVEEVKPTEGIQQQTPEVPEVPIPPEPSIVPEPPEIAAPEAPVLEAQAPELPVDKTQEIAEKTIECLAQLGSRVFTHTPISKSFQKWLGELRGVISEFETSPAISPDEAFKNERTRVFSDLEAEIAKKQLKEEDLEALTEELLASNEILVQLDAGYDTQSSDLLSKKDSRIEALNKSVHDLEAELAGLDEAKTGLLHAFARRAREQRIQELTQRLESTKKKFDLIMENYGLDQDKLHSEYEKKKEATIGEMQYLQEEISNIETDNSLEARQAASKALSDAVTFLIQRNKHHQ